MGKIPFIQKAAVFLGVGLAVNYAIDNLIFEYVTVHGNSLQMMMYVHLLKGFFLVTAAGVFAYLQYRRSIKTYRSIQQNYEVLFKSSPTPILVYNTLNGKILDVNDAASALYGFEEDHLVGMNFQNLVQQVDDEVIEQIKDLMYSEDVEIHRTKSGDLRVVNVESRVQAIDRQITTTISVSDITHVAHQEDKIRQLYADLERKNTYLESLLNLQSSMIVFRTDKKGRIIYSNEVFKDLVASKKHIDESVHIFRLLEDSDSERLKSMFMEMEEGKFTSSNQMVSVPLDNDEVKFFSFEFIMIKDTNGNPSEIQGIGKDITERVKYELSIKEQNEAIRRIAWIQSHELRAPLTRILSAISLYEDSPMSIHPDALFEAVRDSAQKMDKVVHKIVKTSENISEGEIGNNGQKKSIKRSNGKRKMNISEMSSTPEKK